MNRKIHIFPLNRVEGDLKIRLEIENGVVSDAWSSGIMYRGFENIMAGRSPLDGLVITPRICGMCSTAHLKAAAKALDMICHAEVSDNAKRIRNVALMVEMLQNDVRQAFLLFMADFTGPYYKDHPLFDEAVRRYEPLKGQTVIQTVRESKRLLEIVAILGGQWPHSSFMIPGGVASVPSATAVMQCRHLLNTYREWYEHRVLGCTLERWLKVKSRADMDAWLDEKDAHKESDLGFHIRFSRKAELEKIGRGHGNFISFGSLEMPEHTDVTGFRNPKNWVSSLNPIELPDRMLPKNPVSSDFCKNEPTFFPSGFFMHTDARPFYQENITEDVAYAWFNDETDARHPFDGTTQPYATGSEGKKYSWTKAPRYEGLPAETGPLAEMIIGGHPLFIDLLKTEGPNLFVRELARLVRSAMLIPAADIWLRELVSDKENFFRICDKIEEGEGFGLIQAPRGALGHWVKIKEGKIETYQIVTPTAWNASPRDADGIRGPWEESLVGTAIRDVENPVEAGHIVRSYDPCLVCAVHVV